ncbi:MAG: hypothetical protein CM15mP102_04740 [Flavobacteriales bacterium]|nr:MAG: hypothetical protein CM15mP102_04740 [Flavobacteriales bacterium]
MSRYHYFFEISGLKSFIYLNPPLIIALLLSTCSSNLSELEKINSLSLGLVFTKKFAFLTGGLIPANDRTVGA